MKKQKLTKPRALRHAAHCEVHQNTVMGEPAKERGGKI